MPVTTKKILNLHDKVEILLKKYPELKDNDRLLVNTMWNVELQKMNLNPKTTPISMFLSLYKDGKLSDADLIKRARRKLQELNVELRGETWKPRHKESEITRQTI
jgi:hypothetical protein